MKKIFEKIERLKGAGKAVVWVGEDSQYSEYNGSSFPLCPSDPLGAASFNCRVSLVINGKVVDFKINEVL